ncbi:MAG TPA: radical SAM protein [Deltaproteobacteria bacterium]|nr:radical SAM protein [Deltaproteobacteria bacterium]
MQSADFKYIYGPVPSWRLGSSLGIDLLSQAEKVCSFDCTYCQLGRNDVKGTTRSLFVRTGDVMKEIDSLPGIHIDYLTLSGRGEPTLALNLGDIIGALKKIRGEKIAVITNSSIISRKDVREDLLAADFVIAKLDAATDDVFTAINRPAKGVRLQSVIQALVDFRKEFAGRFALQVMFTSANQGSAREISDIAGAIGPDEVQLNTPLRPCMEKPLSADDMGLIKAFFDRQGLRSVDVYSAEKKKVNSLSGADTLRRRGKEA